MIGFAARVIFSTVIAYGVIRGLDYAAEKMKEKKKETDA